MSRPIEHIGRRKLGYGSRHYFCVSPVVDASRFFEQEADRIDAVQLRVLHLPD